MTPGLRQADEGGDDCGDGQRDREPVDAIEAVGDVLGDDDVQAPECAGEQGEPDAGKARGAVPRLGEEHHSDECERGPGEGSPAATVQGSDEQGAEEFDRDRGAEGEQADGGEEGERHARGDEAEEDRCPQFAQGPLPVARPGDEHESEGADGDPHPRGAGDAELVEQVERDGCAELHRQHRHDSEGPGGRPVDWRGHDGAEYCTTSGNWRVHVCRDARRADPR